MTVPHNSLLAVVIGHGLVETYQPCQILRIVISYCYVSIKIAVFHHGIGNATIGTVIGDQSTSLFGWRTIIVTASKSTIPDNGITVHTHQTGAILKIRSLGMNIYIIHHGKRVGEAYHAAPVVARIVAIGINSASRIQSYVLHSSMSYIAKNAHVKVVIIYPIILRIPLAKMMNLVAIAVESAQKWSLPCSNGTEAKIPSFHSEINVVSESHDASLEVIGLAAVQSVHCRDEPYQPFGG